MWQVWDPDDDDFRKTDSTVPISRDIAAAASADLGFAWSTGKQSFKAPKRSVEAPVQAVEPPPKRSRQDQKHFRKYIDPKIPPVSRNAKLKPVNVVDPLFSSMADKLLKVHKHGFSSGRGKRGGKKHRNPGDIFARMLLSALQSNARNGQAQHAEILPLEFSSKELYYTSFQV